MSLEIETFSNVSGGKSLFKALGHPMSAALASGLIDQLTKSGAIALYDPMGHGESFAVLYDTSGLNITEMYVRDNALIGTQRFGRNAQPITELTTSEATTLFVAAFDATRLVDQVRLHLPAQMAVVSLDEMRLPQEMLTKPFSYLDPLNFATNYAFFREGGGHHTRLTTINYWSGYGASATSLWCFLLDHNGEQLAEWRDGLKPGTSSVVIDSQEVRRRFRLGEFTGSLFLHVIGAAGHDIVKYALDTYGDDETVLSCTHDANAWPAQFYAGLPAPEDNEQVIMWIQNSHPCSIPAGTIGINQMGSDKVTTLDREIPPFGTYPLDVAELMPGARWPQQLEVQAGKHFVRPRYEVVNDTGRRHIAHVNVERTDLEPNPELATLTPMFGKGYLLPAPLLPTQDWRTQVMPTPMSTAQSELPVQLLIYDESGNEVAQHRFGRLKRNHETAIDVESLLPTPLTYGHVELIYDFDEGGVADGWLHALFRYRSKSHGHSAQTSFGAHMFNTSLVYRDEPQSYSGNPPGLSTRLFLRLGPKDTETLCHLIYPASTAWHPTSQTSLLLYNERGEEIAQRELAIPCSGSRFWRFTETFDAGERANAGTHAYVVVRDTTCRLFGYHGLEHDGQSFSFDHMFGF